MGGEVREGQVKKLKNFYNFRTVGNKQRETKI